MKKKDLIKELEETRRAHLDTADLMDFYRSCVFDLAKKLIKFENSGIYSDKDFWGTLIFIPHHIAGIGTFTESIKKLSDRILRQLNSEKGDKNEKG